MWTDPTNGSPGTGALLARKVLGALDLLVGRLDDGGVVPVPVGSLGTRDQ